VVTSLLEPLRDVGAVINGRSVNQLSFTMIFPNIFLADSSAVMASPKFEELDLLRLPNYRLMIDGTPSTPFSASTLAPATQDLISLLPTSSSAQRSAAYYGSAASVSFSGLFSDFMGYRKG